MRFSYAIKTDEVFDTHRIGKTTIGEAAGANDGGWNLGALL